MPAGLIVILIAVVTFLLNFILARIIGFSSLVRRTFFSFFLLISAGAVLWLIKLPVVARYLPYPEKLNRYLFFVVLLIGLHISVKIFALLIFDFFFHQLRKITPPRLLKDLMLIILYLIGLLLIFNFYLNVKITVFLASSAVLTIVIGLALQDILGNIFSGMVLNFERILREGYWIKIGEQIGKIEQLSWRSIVIRDLDENLIVIPNQSASKTEIQIFAPEKEYFFCRLNIGLHYRHPPDFVIAVISKVLANYDDVLKVPPFMIYVNEYDQSSIVYQLKYAIADYHQRNRVASEIRRRLWYAFQREGIEIPFPIRTLHIKREQSRLLSAEEKAALLAGNPILQTLPEEKFAELARKAQEVAFGSDEMIISENEIGHNFYQIISGKVKIIKTKQKIAELKAGDFFGEISIVTGEPANASVIAQEETRLLAITAYDFKQIVEMDQQLAEKLAEVIIHRQAETATFCKNQTVDEQTKETTTKSRLLERIISYFGLR